MVLFSGCVCHKTATPCMGHGRAGSEADPGIVPRAIDRIFEQCRARQEMHTATISLSYFQLYNEKAYDLLAPLPVAPVATGSSAGQSGTQAHSALAARGSKDAARAAVAAMAGLRMRWRATVRGPSALLCHAQISGLLHPFLCQSARAN